MRRLLACAGLLVAGTASAQPLFDEIPLADVLEVVVLDRTLVAIDARGGGQTSERLDLDERVLWTGARGSVGVALTDERLLAVGASSGSWQEARYLRIEEPADRALLGERVALVTTDVRALGFDGGSGNLVETRLGPRERVVARRIGENVAVVVTGRRALGLSPFVGGFFPIKLDLFEQLEDVTALANLATVTTDRRVLIFRAPTGSWEERRRDLRP